jgi:glycosyltransferase involved in cell wall biosynthesis
MTSPAPLFESLPERRRTLLFVSPRFLFPADSGGKIRTAQILRGMKDGRYEITLASPVPPGGLDRYSDDLCALCTRFVGWPEPRRGPSFEVLRLRHLASRLPVPVATDRSAVGRRVIETALSRRPDVAVFDFPHAAMLAPRSLPVPSVLFTHNVESEIFRRHADVSSSPFKRIVWRNQLRKMERFERDALSRFQTVVAVSERDAAWFREGLGIDHAEVIPTGVDTGFFPWSPPGEMGRVAFTGSMDWLANIDAMDWFLDDVWDRVARQAPGASMRVIGRNPPAGLASRVRERGLPWELTGFVDDVRPHLRGSSVYVIPLRVGGGTRIKVFEAMAMGCPVVSTSIGVEGLPLEPGRHYLRADTADDFADAVVRLLRDPELRLALSREARRHVEERFSFRRAAEAFEEICRRTEEKSASGEG